MAVARHGRVPCPGLQTDTIPAFGNNHYGQPPIGTTFTFTLNEQAQVTLTFSHTPLGARSKAAV